MWRFIASMLVVATLGACAMVQKAPLTGFWYTGTDVGGRSDSPDEHEDGRSLRVFHSGNHRNG